MRRTRIVRIVRCFIPNIRIGTESYPEKIARRLRAFNIAVWIAAMVPATMAIVRFFDGKLAVGIADIFVATIYASMPLLHRLGPLVAPITFASVSYAVIFWVNSLVGTNGGSSLGYFTATALSILIIGTEHYLIGATIGIVSIALAIITELVLPRDSGFVSSTFLIVTNYAASVAFTSTILYGIIFYAVRQMERAEAIAEREYRRSEGLLANILPPSIAARLKGSTSAIADAYPEASILFADMAGFTARASDTSPEDLVHFLNSVYTRIDNIVERHGLEKIKTSGDAYMVVSGVPEALPDHACAIADLALDIRDALSGLVDPRGRAVPVRIGIASGPVVAGVVGRRKFFYDVWGDAVNTASRMESTGEIGQIQVAPDTRELIASRFELKERGIIEIRGKGPMRTWFLVGRKPAIAESSVESGHLGRSKKISDPL
jgi:adenylate cyclase